MYCYAVNGRCASPARIWLTGCGGEMETQLQRIPGFNKWIIEKEDKSYIEALQDQKETLVYLTADTETILDDLDPTKIYIIGGLVDRNRWKGITMKKANDQVIQSARLPIGSYLKMSSSQACLSFAYLFSFFSFEEMLNHTIYSIGIIKHTKPNQIIFASFATNYSFQLYLEYYSYHFITMQIIMK